MATVNHEFYAAFFFLSLSSSFILHFIHGNGWTLDGFDYGLAFGIIQIAFVSSLLTYHILSQAFP